MVKVIKAYKQITTTIKSPADIAFEDDRAMTDFRGFYHVADVHTERVNSVQTLEVLEEVITNIQNSLQHRKKVLISQVTA